MAKKLAKQDFTLGALYKLGARRGFNRETLVVLMVNRCRLSEAKAKQLAGHWLTTHEYRQSGITPAL